ncbi:SpaA isopeptide-forming pilin-related protein [[Collinsella] massiliensis]|nr:FctA domain-containing protein [[Collinsella] massiliensis]
MIKRSRMWGRALFGRGMLFALACVAFVIAGTTAAYAASYGTWEGDTAEYTVPGVSPRGTTINLFDYWLTGDSTKDNQKWTSDAVKQELSEAGINASHELKFGNQMGGYGGAWNKWTGSSNPRSGLVESTLHDGYPQGTDILSNQSLAYLFDGTDDTSGTPGKRVYRDVNDLLQVDDNGYYYYSSKKNFAQYNADTNDFTLYNRAGIKSNGASGENGQFFPFDSGSEVFTVNGAALEPSGIVSTSNDLNHFFGMSMSTQFVQRYGGHTSEDGGTTVTYNFSGDDDVWIYIDGVLVGDLGGLHDAASITIDFSTGGIVIYEDKDGDNEFNDGDQKLSSTTLKDCFKSAGASTDAFNEDNSTFKDDTYHTLDFFYLERGAVDSNMSLRYNLMSIPESGIVKVDQAGTGIENIGFTLYPADENYDYDENTANPVHGTTTKDGEMVFTYQNAAGQDVPIALEQLGLRSAYWVLVEDKVPNGYRGGSEIHLRFSTVNDNGSGEGVLLVSNQWETGAYSQPHVTAIAGAQVTDMDNQTYEAADGVMFAVVMQKGENDRWHPVTGNAFDGWNVAAGTEDDKNAVLEAAKADGYVFALGTGGGYEVTIENLPGDITTYAHMIQTRDNLSVDDAEAQAAYTVRYYYCANAASLDEITNASNIVQINPNVEGDDFQRIFSVTLNIPNIKNELSLVKTDATSGEPMPEVEFKLYKDADRDGQLDTGQDAVVHTMTTDEQGRLQVTTDGDILADGSYVLVETTPDGYIEQTPSIRIEVGDDGVHVNAGTADDNVTVETGIGELVYSMNGFAANDQVDPTLHDVKAQPQARESYPDDADWKDIDGAAELHYHYNNTGDNSLDYVATDSAHASYTAQAGWSRLNVQQCLNDHGDGTGTSNSDKKQNLGGQSLNALFTGEVTIHVTNQKKYEGDLSYSAEGDLTIVKHMRGADIKDGQFSFKVTAASDEAAALIGIADGQRSEVVSLKGDTPMGDDGVATAGMTIFNDMAFSSDHDGKTFTYTVEEVIPEGADARNRLDGIVYDDTVYTVEVAVDYDDATGKLTATTTVVADGDEGSARTYVYDNTGAEHEAAVLEFENAVEEQTPPELPSTGGDGNLPRTGDDMPAVVGGIALAAAACIAGGALLARRRAGAQR